MNGRVVSGTIALLIAALARADAQDRPFLLSVTTGSPTARTAVRVDYDVGAGERAFQSDTGNQPEQRISVQASHGRLTLIGRFGLSDRGSSYQSSQAGELLVSFVDGRTRPFALAAGGGVQHEAGGVNVLLARIVTGRESDTWRLHGNILFQKPLATDRDRMDLITTVGWALKLTPALAIGVEGIGEDLEGFWNATEAEGGARILAGPSLHVAPAGRKWQVTATGGPTFHPSDTGRSNAALRDLPSGSARTGYAVRVGLTYRVF